MADTELTAEMRRVLTVMAKGMAVHCHRPRHDGFAPRSAFWASLTTDEKQPRVSTIEALQRRGLIEAEREAAHITEKGRQALSS